MIIMRSEQASTQKTLTLLLSGKHPLTKRYAGKNVLVIQDEVVPLKKGKKTLDNFKKLKEKYGEPPVVVFVPHPDVSYILIF